MAISEVLPIAAKPRAQPPTPDRLAGLCHPKLPCTRQTLASRTPLRREWSDPKPDSAHAFELLVRARFESADFDEDDCEYGEPGGSLPPGHTPHSTLPSSRCGDENWSAVRLRIPEVTPCLGQDMGLAFQEATEFHRPAGAIGFDRKGHAPTSVKSVLLDTLMH